MGSSDDIVSQDDSGILRAKTLFDYFDDEDTDAETANWKDYRDWQESEYPEFGFSSERDFNLIREQILSGNITRQEAAETFQRLMEADREV